MTLLEIKEMMQSDEYQNKFLNKLPHTDWHLFIHQERLTTSVHLFFYVYWVPPMEQFTIKKTVVTNEELAEHHFSMRTEMLTGFLIE